MSTDTPTPSTTPSGGPILTEHAIERWTERVCSRQDGIAPWDLPEAFRRALPVGIPNHRNRGRLHEPSGTVIVFTRDWSRGPPVLLTVLYASRMSINDDHLKPCPKCGLRYNVGVAPCPWCSQDTPED